MPGVEREQSSRQNQPKTSQNSFRAPPYFLGEFDSVAALRFQPEETCAQKPATLDRFERSSATRHFAHVAAPLPASSKL